MARLMGQYFADSPLLLLPIISLFFFGAAFIFACSAALSKSRKECVDVAALPLEDDSAPSQESSRD